MSKARVERIALTSNDFEADDNAPFEQQLLDVAQAQLNPVEHAHGATVDACRQAMVEMKRNSFAFRIARCYPSHSAT
ncbi:MULTISPECIES: hypothetical protein [Paraburkholderia]|uniref:Uncharacterized protein n=1 Tax=Paraburkholderia caribensis TaxID=75105 RepID=A0ABV0E8Q2_9BURK|nr:MULTISPECIES: hypothetical protein [Paraburkholderia]MCO4882625.1 hypothetical protein [Paraburkholderia caribensis]